MSATIHRDPRAVVAGIRAEVAPRVEAWKERRSESAPTQPESRPFLSRGQLAVWVGATAGAWALVWVLLVYVPGELARRGAQPWHAVLGLVVLAIVLIWVVVELLRREPGGRTP